MSSTTRRVYTFSDLGDAFVKKAARWVAGRYGRYGVGFDDASQEMFAWLYGKGEKNVRRWLASDPQQTTRIYMSLVDVGRSYGEGEKAARVGFETDDVMWYSATLVEGLMPLVLDPTFTGFSGEQQSDGGRGRKPPNEGGDLLALVLDIRRALAGSPAWVSDVFVSGDPGDVGWGDAVAHLVNWLGGERPTVGRRRVQSNALAQFVTRGQESA